MKKLKSNNGITLLSLIIYMIVMLIIIAIIASIRENFLKSMDYVKDNARYAASFDKFNSYFVKDVKNNSTAAVSEDTETGNSIITFYDGTTYIYNIADKAIYRGKVQIANNVTAFTIQKKEVVVNNVTKQVLDVNMSIGITETKYADKRISYTLKYW